MLLDFRGALKNTFLDGKVSSPNSGQFHCPPPGPSRGDVDNPAYGVPWDGRHSREGLEEGQAAQPIVSPHLAQMQHGGGFQGPKPPSGTFCSRLLPKRTLEPT